MPYPAFWMVVSAMALAEVAIVVTALRMRLRPGPRRGIVGTRAAEVVWTLLPVLLLAVIIIASLQLLRDNASEAPSGVGHGALAALARSSWS